MPAERDVLSDRKSTATLWLCAAGKCPPITWTKTANGPDVPFCSCRVEAKRGGFYRYVDREPVKYVPRSEFEALRDALADVINHWVLSDAPEQVVIDRAVEALDLSGTFDETSAACPVCGRVMKPGSLCYGAPGQPEHEAAHATNAPKETR